MPDHPDHPDSLLDIGSFGDGVEDPYTAPEHMRRVYFLANQDRTSMRGTVTAPPSWTCRQVERELARRFGWIDISVSRDVRHVRRR